MTHALLITLSGLVFGSVCIVTLACTAAAGRADRQRKAAMNSEKQENRLK